MFDQRHDPYEQFGLSNVPAQLPGLRALRAWPFRRGIEDAASFTALITIDGRRLARSEARDPHPSLSVCPSFASGPRL